MYLAIVLLPQRKVTIKMIGEHDFVNVISSTRFVSNECYGKELILSGNQSLKEAKLRKLDFELIKKNYSQKMQKNKELKVPEPVSSFRD